MKRRDRTKHKGRRESGGFIAIPHAVQDSENWRNCGGTAIKLLCALARQYNGKNNGDLCAAAKIVKPYGFTSADTLHWALRELLHYRLIEMTRQGGLEQGPNLYALTWHPIDDCGGKLDVLATKAPTGAWKQAVIEPFKRPKREKKNEEPYPETGAAPLRKPERCEQRTTVAAPETGAIKSISGRSPAPETGDLYRYLPRGAQRRVVSGGGSL